MKSPIGDLVPGSFEILGLLVLYINYGTSKRKNFKIPSGVSLGGIHCRLPDRRRDQVRLGANGNRAREERKPWRKRADWKEKILS